MTTNDLNSKEFKALFFIRDRILYHGKSPSLQAISDHLGFKSRRSAALLIDRLAKRGYIERTAYGNLRLCRDIDGRNQITHVIEIPLVGAVPCGLPLLAEENVEAMVPISQKIVKPGAQYFLLRAMGDSMNKAGIKEGDLLVVRQQPVANDGENVVALIGDSATVKEFRRSGNKVILMPRSSNPTHQPIVLDEDFMIQGVVIDVISDLHQQEISPS